MKIRTAIIISVVLNLGATLGLIFAHKNLFFSFLLPLNILTLPKKIWARQTLTVFLYIGLILNFGWLVYQIYITEDTRSLWWILSALILGIIYFIYSLLTFTSQVAKSYYKTETPRDPYNPEGWICPKCSSKMVFAIKCWNCEFKRGEDKRTIDSEILKPSTTKEDNKIDSYLKKKVVK